MSEENKPVPNAELENLKASNAKLMQELEALKGKPAPTPEPDLADKARLEREAKDKAGNDSKALESALKFTLQKDDFLKKNGALLPNEVADIFAAAEKEKYSSEIEKAQAIKSAMIQSFFKVQSNLDLLTSSQKNQLEDYLKLTKTGKEEKAQSIYDSIFEPSFEMLKKLKKADALGKGFGTADDYETKYKNKLVKLSQDHYGVKPKEKI